MKYSVNKEEKLASRVKTFFSSFTKWRDYSATKLLETITRYLLAYLLQAPLLVVVFVGIELITGLSSWPTFFICFFLLVLYTTGHEILDRK